MSTKIPLYRLELGVTYFVKHKAYGSVLGKIVKIKKEDIYIEIIEGRIRTVLVAVTKSAGETVHLRISSCEFYLK